MRLRLAMAGLAVLGVAEPAAARLDCVRAEFHTEMYRRACADGGQVAAKEAASRFMAAQQSAEPALRCTSCHRSLAPDYRLMPDAVARFEALSSSQAGARPAPAGPTWSPMGAAVPADAVGGGSEGGRTLYVCRASHAGGQHPGKIIGSRCSIGYLGREHRSGRFEVLTGPADGLRWVRGDSPEAKTMLRTPTRLVKGQAGGLALPVCRARVLGGMHPGKYLNGTCNIGYGGREMRVRRFELLVQ